MDNSENKKRVLDLLWKNYQDQVASSRRFGDRVTIVLGATIGVFGLVVKLNESNTMAATLSTSCVVTAVVALSVALFCAAVVWLPKKSQQPSGTDVDRIWGFLVAVDDDASAATLMSDICKATKAERSNTETIACWFTCCLVACGIALVAAIGSELL